MANMKGYSAWLRVAPEDSKAIFYRDVSRTTKGLAHGAFTSVAKRMGIEVKTKKVMAIDWQDEKLKPCVAIHIIDRSGYKEPQKRGRNKLVKNE